MSHPVAQLLACMITATVFLITVILKPLLKVNKYKHIMLKIYKFGSLSLNSDSWVLDNLVGEHSVWHESLQHSVCSARYPNLSRTTGLFVGFAAQLMEILDLV